MLFWFIGLTVIFILCFPHGKKNLAWGADNGAVTANGVDNAVDNILARPDEPVFYLPPGKTVTVHEPNAGGKWDNLACGELSVRHGADRQVPKILLDKIDEVIAVERGCLEPHFAGGALYLVCVETEYKGPEFSVYLVRTNKNGRRYWEALKKVCR